MSGRDFNERFRSLFIDRKLDDASVTYIEYDAMGGQNSNRPECVQLRKKSAFVRPRLKLKNFLPSNRRR